MGHICVDGTNTIDDMDDGAPNSQIPKPGTPGQLNENPAIAYSMAFQPAVPHMALQCLPQLAL